MSAITPEVNDTRVNAVPVAPRLQLKNSRGRRLERSCQRGALRQLDPVAVGIAHHRDSCGAAERDRRPRLAAAMRQYVSVLAIDLKDLERDVAPARAVERG